MSKSLESTGGVSIVICTYNGRHRLEKTLKHAIRQTSSFPFEIVVVDNSSKDGTGMWVREYAEQAGYSALIRIVEEMNLGLSYARFRGVFESKFPIILFCDDDNWLSENYLEIGAAKFMENPKLGALGGEGIPVFESEKPDWFDQFSHSYAVGDLGMKSGILPRGGSVYGAGCFFRKAALEELLEKGWSSILSDRKGSALGSGGDVELCYAVQLLGYSIGFEKQLKFQHYIEKSRLEWDYYIKLKEGISNSFPILIAYEFDSFPTLRYFQIHLISSFLTVVKGLIKTTLLPQNTRQRKVDYKVVRTKFWAFLKNYQSAIDGYKRNKRIFGS